MWIPQRLIIVIVVAIVAWWITKQLLAWLFRHGPP